MGIKKYITSVVISVFFTAVLPGLYYLTAAHPDYEDQRNLPVTVDDLGQVKTVLLGNPDEEGDYFYLSNCYRKKINEAGCAEYRRIVLDYINGALPEAEAFVEIQNTFGQDVFKFLTSTAQTEHRASVLGAMVGMKHGLAASGKIQIAAIVVAFTKGVIATRGSWKMPEVAGVIKEKLTSIKGKFESFKARLAEVLRKYRPGGVLSLSKLKDWLGRIKPPEPTVFDGTLYRTVGNGLDPLHTHPIPKGLSHRYSKPGEDALYFSSSHRGNIAEMTYSGGNVKGTHTTFVYDKTKINNLLDLTSKEIRTLLRIDLKSITSNSYDHTHMLGTWAKKHYDGIIAPSARGDGFVNVVIFKSKTINSAIKGKPVGRIKN